MTYSIYGPFTDGFAPPVNQTFLNNLESFLTTVNGAATDPYVTSDNVKGWHANNSTYAHAPCLRIWTRGICCSAQYCCHFDS